MSTCRAMQVSIFPPPLWAFDPFPPGPALAGLYGRSAPAQMCRRDPEDPTVKKERILRCQPAGLSVPFSSMRRCGGKSRRTRDDVARYWSRLHTCRGGGCCGALQRGGATVSAARRALPGTGAWCGCMGRGVRSRDRARRLQGGWSRSAAAVVRRGRGEAVRGLRLTTNPSRGQRPRAWRCRVWCGVWSPSLMGGMGWGSPSRGTGFSEELVGGCSNGTTQRWFAPAGPSGSAQAREFGVLGVRSSQVLPGTQCRERRCER